jgi:hypothetical protein
MKVHTLRDARKDVKDEHKYSNPLTLAECPVFSFALCNPYAKTIEK